MIEIGDPFPPFELRDQDECPFKSTDLAGSWYLIYWYPKADTPGCTVQAEGLRDQIEAFDELACRVLGVSFDDAADNAAFRAKYSLPFPLLSDIDHELAVAVGAADAPEVSYAQRVAYLVNAEGLVAHCYVVDSPEFFAERVLDNLEDLMP